GVGQPTRKRGGLHLHEVLHALRKRGGPSIPGNPGGDQPQRHPGPLPRTGQVGGPPAGALTVDPGAAQDRDGRRTRRPQRPLRRLEGRGVRDRLAPRPRRRHRLVAILPAPAPVPPVAPEIVRVVRRWEGPQLTIELVAPPRTPPVRLRLHRTN